ncbi:MAG TPA: nitroreductase family protein [bacterium]
MSDPKLIPLSEYRRLPQTQMIRRAEELYLEMRRRRTVRDFSNHPVPKEIIDSCLRAAGTAPSGANRQPWHFVVVSNPDVKKKIRAAAEKEEEAFYGGRAPDDWLAALAPIGTDAQKPYLETAPYLIVIFAQTYELAPHGSKVRNYYVQESVGIATGLLITAIHHVGLASLTHTPSPMGFLNELLARPANERPFLILVVGYPADDAQVPDIGRKSLQEIATFIE